MHSDRLYAKRFPTEVAGLVLLDPTHENIVDYLSSERAPHLHESSTDGPFTPEQLDAMRSAYRTTFGRALADWPDEIRVPLLDRALATETHRRAIREPRQLPRVFDEVRAAGPDPAVPTVYVSAMGTDVLAEHLVPPEARAALAESNRTKHRLYTDPTSAQPHTRLHRLDDVGHAGIAWVRPDAVVEAIRHVFERIRVP